MGYKAEDFYKSTYLKAGDFPEDADPIVDRVEGELVGQEKELKPVLYLRGVERGIVLNRTNFDALAHGYGDDTDGWRSKPVIVTVKAVQYQGKTVDAIRLEVPRRKAVVKPEPPDTHGDTWEPDERQEDARY